MKPLTEQQLREVLVLRVGTTHGAVAAWARRHGIARTHLSSAMNGGPLQSGIVKALGYELVVPAPAYRLRADAARAGEATK